MLESLFFALLGFEMLLILLIVVDEVEGYVTPRQFIWPILSFIVCIILASGVGILERTYVVADGTGAVMEYTVTSSGGAPLIWLFTGLALISSLILVYRSLDMLAYYRKIREG